MAETSAQRAVVIERTYDAPVASSGRCGPTRSLPGVVRPDRRDHPGRDDGREGRRAPAGLHAGADPGGPMEMWFTGEYREVVENQRLVYTESNSDADGNVISPANLGMPEDHPQTTEVSVELEDVGGRTKLVLTHRGIPAGSPGAAGWSMALDKLADYVHTP